MKIEGDGKSKGYKEHTLLHITTDIIEKYDSGNKIWDEVHIEERTERLFEKVLEIWPV